MKSLIITFIIIVVNICTTPEVNAQNKSFVPDLLYLNEDFYSSGNFIECFDKNDNPTNYTTGELKYCIVYQTNKLNERVLKKRIEQVGDKWIVTDLTINKLIYYKADKEIIVEIDEISGFTEKGEMVSYKIFYYKTIEE